MNSFKKAGVLAVGSAALVMAGTGAASASSEADAAAVKSSGVFSGNIGQAPFHTPAEGCANTANAVAALNPAFGSECVIAEIENNDYDGEDYDHEGEHHRPQGQPHGGGGYRHDDGHRSLLERVGV
ncbi:chaplin [Embleya hyalina]|uniref:Membrane protein n=1 Tax=Embleya hyalina TaxID=516124 RepID=A0A401YMH8_9ACTN|nr:chaplin [Embleya hyalina]GCD95823.1 membrane protein [Embleya hyalina]